MRSGIYGVKSSKIQLWVRLLRALKIISKVHCWPLKWIFTVVCQVGKRFWDRRYSYTKIVWEPLYWPCKYLKLQWVNCKKCYSFELITVFYLSIRKSRPCVVRFINHFKKEPNWYRPFGVDTNIKGLEMQKQPND